MYFSILDLRFVGQRHLLVTSLFLLVQKNEEASFVKVGEVTAKGFG